MDVECYVLEILLLFFPARIGIYEELGVVVTAVACHLLTYEIGFAEGFVFRFQFHFGYYQSGVIAIELIHLERMLSVGTLHQPTTFVYHATPTQFEEMLRFVVADLFFKLIA